MLEKPKDGRSSSEASIFERFSPDDVRELVREYPLAWVFARGAEDPAPSLLPLLGDYDALGRLVGLVGHMSRRNPLVEAFSHDPRALILFQGPSAYVSPDQAGRRDWAPTWNYAQLSIEATVRITPTETDAAIRRLVTTMEADRPAPWDVDAIEGRYATMLEQIIGFRADVIRLKGRFKVGQDETPATAQAIMATTADPALVRWMTRFNKDRA